MNHVLHYNRNYVLRKMLNNEESKEIVRDLIESILHIKIESISINPYAFKNERFLPKEENFGVVDVRIKTSEHESYNVGVQFLDGKHIATKIALYYLYIHSNQTSYDDNRKIVKTITVNILDFPYQSKTYHEVTILNDFKTLDFKEQEAEAHLIELPKFKVSDPKKLTREEQWISYIQGADLELVEKSKKENKYIEKLDKMVQDYWDRETI